MKTDFDAIIVGSGPSGCSTALHLARLDPTMAARTLVLEKASHPRYKLCGGGVVSDVDVILKNLGLDINEVPYADARVAQLNFKDRGFPITLSHIAFHVVRRREFDAWLAGKVQQSGIALQDQTRVDDVRPTASGVEVHTSRGVYRARVVVGCDGSKGVVRRAVHGEDGGPVARVIEVITPPPPGGSEPPHPRDEAIFDFRFVPDGMQGYFWSFPMVDGGKPMRNLGVYDSRTVEATSSGSLKEFLAPELIKQGLRLEDCKIEGHPIHTFTPRTRLSAPGVILAGDAAGADPLLGEGISLAMGYGDLASRAVLDAFAADDFRFTDYAQRVHSSPMGRALRRRYRGARLIYGVRSPLLQRLVWWHCQTLVRSVIRNYMFRWARPGLPAPVAVPRGLPSALPSLDIAQR
ncbi:MAG: NAD(P)/FAD-dependent oxidoreductase [Myxococcales bacterium]|nr:NAD(P)/FAD-dependent oxidoreductase [Myxococcales bacterium]